MNKRQRACASSTVIIALAFSACVTTDWLVELPVYRSDNASDKVIPVASDEHTRFIDLRIDKICVPETVNIDDGTEVLVLGEANMFLSEPVEIRTPDKVVGTADVYVASGGCITPMKASSLSVPSSNHASDSRDRAILERANSRVGAIGGFELGTAGVAVTLRLYPLSSHTGGLVRFLVAQNNALISDRDFFPWQNSDVYERNLSALRDEFASESMKIDVVLLHKQLVEDQVVALGRTNVGGIWSLMQPEGVLDPTNARLAQGKLFEPAIDRYFATSVLFSAKEATKTTGFWLDLNQAYYNIGRTITKSVVIPDDLDVVAGEYESVKKRWSSHTTATDEKHLNSLRLCTLASREIARQRQIWTNATITEALRKMDPKESAGLAKQFLSNCEVLQMTPTTSSGLWPVVRIAELHVAANATATSDAVKVENDASGTALFSFFDSAAQQVRAADALRAQDSRLAELENRIASDAKALEAVQLALKTDGNTDISSAIGGLIETAKAYQRLRESIDKFKSKLKAASGSRFQIALRNGRAVIVLTNTFLFDSKKDEISPPARAFLVALAPVLVDLVRDSDARIQINGHTDNVKFDQGSLIDNWGLSFGRANAVRQFLADSGVPSKSMSIAAFAEFDPADPRVDNDSSTARGANRRAEIEVVFPNPVLEMLLRSN